MKACNRCRESKGEGEFPKNASEKDGLNRQCRACIHAYYVRNAERLKARAAAYRAAHPEKAKAAQRAAVAKDPAKYRERIARWCREHPERVSEYQRRYREGLRA